MRPRSRGFSLVELVVVVMVLSILAAVAVPQFMITRGTASVARTAQDLRIISDAAEMYYTTYQTWPKEAAPGVIPKGLGDFLKDGALASPCPLGGKYDWVLTGLGTRVEGGVLKRTGISIVWTEPNVPPLDLCLKLDLMIDNGNLSSGRVLMPNTKTLILVQDSAVTASTPPAAAKTD